MAANKKPLISIIEEIKTDIRNCQINVNLLTTEIVCIRKLVEEILKNQNKVLLANSEIEKFNKSLEKTEPIRSGWWYSD